MGVPLWVCRNKTNQGRVLEGFITDLKPRVNEPIKGEIKCQMVSFNSAQLSYSILSMLGVKEGECKQFEFEEITNE